MHPSVSFDSSFLFQEKHAREEEERKRRIQLYVFVLRCIAYNFNAKQPNDMQKRHLKVSKEGHERMKARVEVSPFSRAKEVLQGVQFEKNPCYIMFKYIFASILLPNGQNFSKQIIVLES